MSRSHSPALRPLLACLAAAGFVAACGGSDSPAAPPVTTTISGDVVKGPVSGSNVCAFKATAAGKGEQIKCTTTGAGGSYSMAIEYTGDVVIEAVGGTYTDEATGSTLTLTEPMQVVVASQGGATVGMVTPLTSAAYSVSKGLTGGVSSANFGSAASSVATQFNLNGVNLATTAPIVTGTTNAYGQILRATSQYLANGHTLASFLAFASPTALQAGFATAYATINGSTLTFTFTGTGIGGGGNGGGNGGGGGGAESCGISVSGTGTITTSGMTIPFTLPATKICVTGVPAGTCSAGNSTLQSLADGGATPQGDYSLSYSYSYSANDCSGAIATVAFQ